MTLAGTGRFSPGLCLKQKREMNQESIPINTTKEKFFNEYLILKKPIIDALLTRINGERTTLSDIPRNVFAQLLYFNDYYKDYPEQEKWKMVFSKNTKDVICDELDLKEHQLNGYLSQLRKLKILNGKTINRPFIVYPGGEHTISFKFNINGHTE